jgi:hypothetical protein
MNSEEWTIVVSLKNEELEQLTQQNVELTQQLESKSKKFDEVVDADNAMIKLLSGELEFTQKALNDADDLLKKKFEELEASKKELQYAKELIKSAISIAQRKGVDTYWDGFLNKCLGYIWGDKWLERASQWDIAAHDMKFQEKTRSMAKAKKDTYLLCADDLKSLAPEKVKDTDKYIEDAVEKYNIEHPTDQLTHNQIGFIKNTVDECMPKELTNDELTEITCDNLGSIVWSQRHTDYKQGLIFMQHKLLNQGFTPDNSRDSRV